MISCCSSRDSTWEMGRRLPGVKCYGAEGWILPGQRTEIVRAPRKCMSVFGRLYTVLDLPPLGGAHSAGFCPNPRVCLGLCLWIYGVWTTFASQKLCLEVPGDLQRWSSPCALNPPEAAMDGGLCRGSPLPCQHAHRTHPSWLQPSRSLQHGEPRPPVPCPEPAPRRLFPPDCP